MKNTNLNILISEYKELELRAHVNIDDVLNKVTQEVSELVEAILDSNEEEIIKEARDSIVNVLSVAKELWLELEDKYNNNEEKDNLDAAKLFVKLGKWNQKVQAIRKRYSRDVPSIQEFDDINQDLVGSLLKYVSKWESLSQVVSFSIQKFSKRVDAYLPAIELKDHMDEYADFPKKWILFKDIAPMLEDPEVMRNIAFKLAQASKNADVIAGLDARWFLFWIQVAQILDKPFVMVRKKWKLPWKVVSSSYSLEYGENVIEMQEGSIKEWQKVALIDDLLATWGTMLAAAWLVEKLGWIVNNVSFVISLDEQILQDSPARKELGKYEIGSLVSYQ